MSTWPGRRSYRARRSYRVGSTAWILHRVTGLLILAYLYFHLIVLSSIIWPGGAKSFNPLVAELTSPLFIYADLVLFAIILYHALNGIRLLFFDLGVLLAYQRQLFWVMMAVGVAALAGSAIALLPLAGL